MATTKPRIQVTLKPSQYDLLKRLAKVQKRPMSAVLSELFDEIEPVYERMATVLEAAMRAQASAKKGMVDAFKATEEEMRPHVAAAMGQFDLLEQSFGLSASGSGGATSGATTGPVAATPALVTRGSGIPRAHTQTAPLPPPQFNVSPRKSRNSRTIRKSPGRSVRSLAASIARQVKKGPKKGRRP